ncbi:MAG: S8 family serine peptidase [Planctomycetota bacterium]|jgi:thermitase
MFTRTAIISIIIAGLICLVVTASGVIHDSEPDGILAGEVQEPNYVEGELLVRFAKKPDGTILTRHERNTILASFDVQEKGAYTLVPGLTIVKLPKGMKVEEAIVSLEKRPEILYAEPDYILKALFTPNDPKFDEQ